MLGGLAACVQGCPVEAPEGLDETVNTLAQFGHARLLSKGSAGHLHEAAAGVATLLAERLPNFCTSS